MAPLIVIQIREKPSSSPVDGKVDVFLTYASAGHQHVVEANEPALPQTCVRSLSLPRDGEEQSITWFMEKYVQEPLSTTRAEHAKAYIQKQASALYSELQIDEGFLFTHVCGEVILEVMDSEHICRLHWEALETMKLWREDITVKVCRIVTPKSDCGLLQRASTQTNNLTLNILLVVARGDKDIDHRITARPLVRMLHRYALRTVVVDIARPGTMEAFLEYLSKKDYDVVHFDMHGEVEESSACLLFRHPLGSGTVKVSADEIGRALFVHRVRLVIMNACKSAFVSGCIPQTNFAAQLARHGIDFVVGMAYQVSDSAVEIFHETFYDSILRDRVDVLSAIHDGRVALESNKIRASQLFSLPVQLEDYLVPALYTSCSHTERKRPFILFHGVENEAITASYDTTADTCGTKFADELVGRDHVMLEIENTLLRDRVCLVEGNHGVGKWSLLAYLAQWFIESRLVEHIFTLDCSSTSPTTEGAYATLYQQIPADEIKTVSVPQQGHAIYQELLSQYVLSHECMLIIRNVEDRPDWVASLILDLAFPAQDEEQEHRGALIAISSTKELNWLYSVHGKNLKPVKLAELEVSDATKLAEAVLEDGCKVSAKEEKRDSALWYKQRLLELLQFHPLAIKMAFAAVATTNASWVYWHLQTSQLPLDWQHAPAARLVAAWTPLLQQHSDVLKCLLPFQESVSGNLLEAIFPSPPHGLKNSLMSAIHAMESCGAAMRDTDGPKSEISRLKFHPLFCQFLRSQAWSEQDVQRTWYNLSVCYHNKSLEWIHKGMYKQNITTNLKREWQNLVTGLDKLLPEVGKDSEDSSLFDLVWMVCSFHIFYKGMPKFASDIFADITTAALQVVVPEFAVSSNYAWQMLIQAGLRSRARKLSSWQVIRAILYCQFLIQYFYDVSTDTSRAYQASLSILLDSVRRDNADTRFGKLLELAKGISFLTEAEFATEEGCYLGTGKIWHEYAAKVELPAKFAKFAEIWSNTQIHRALGYHPDYRKTFTNLSDRIGTELPLSEWKSRMEPIQTLVDTFEALNGGEDALEYGRKKLEQRLEVAIQNGDSRQQLDLYEKLVEVYTRTRDWQAVLFILDKIDECAQDVERLLGNKVDEVTTLQRQRWMTTRRAQCLKYLGRIIESKDMIRHLRRIVARREALWSKEDRAKEQARNVEAMLEQEMADAAKKNPTGLGEFLSGKHAFMLQRFYTDDDMPQDKKNVEVEKLSAQLLAGQSSSDLDVGIAIMNSSVGDTATGRSDAEFANTTSLNMAAKGSTRDGNSDNETAPVQPTYSQKEQPLLQSENGLRQEFDELEIPSTTDQDEDESDNMLTDGFEELDTNSDEESSYENDDADDLYLILNPWMKGIMNWMDGLVQAGAKPVSTYMEFQMPPGHVGGYFLMESRRFMAEDVLRALEVLGEAVN